MSLPRRLEPEWLDQLPADDPRAIRSRRNLARINAYMLNARCMAAALRKLGAARQPRTIVDLGCGDGRFMLQVARRLAPHWRDIKIVLQDRQDIVSAATRDAFAALRWHAEPVCADVFDFLAAGRCPPVDVVTCNLFLHHFTDQQLARLLAAAARLAWLVVACEPRRARFVVRMSRMLRMVGCSDVTVHDAVASARAGFTGNELSVLWPGREGWELNERAGAIFTHYFAARRLSSASEGRSTRPGRES